MSEIKEITFNVSGMHCASCATNTQRKLQKTPGVLSAEVSYANHEAQVRYDPEKATNQDLTAAVESLGYGTALGKASVHESHNHTHYDKENDLKLRLIVSLILTAPLLMAMIPGMPMWLSDPRLQLLLATPVQFWVGKQYYISAWKALKNGMTNMDTLIVLGTTVAYAFSVVVMLFGEELMRLGIDAHVYFETSAAIITFIMLGKYLEAKATAQTSQAIVKLLDLQAKKARIIQQGKEKMVDVNTLSVGDVVKVKPGEKIPVDGTVQEGEAYVDESMVTGESLAVLRKKGDAVIGASINTNSTLIIKVNKIGEDTFLAQVINLVKSAQSSKAPIQKLVDQVSAIFVPGVIILALITLGIWMVFGPEPKLVHALVAFISVLIIACPCALGLATPVSIMVGVGKGAQQGILIRDAENLEVAGKISQLIFDKTGTLTEGKPKLQGILLLDPKMKAGVETAIYSLENESHHPLAQAVVEALSSVAQKETVNNFEDFPGKGISGMIQGKRALIGTKQFLMDEQVSLDASLMAKAQDLAEKSLTVSHIAINQQHVALMTIGDKVKAESAAVIKVLARMGIVSTLLTGDNTATAHAVGKQLGIRHIQAEVLPQDKQEKVASMKARGEIVGMVGDGINDAPALAAADIGIAMGMGTDIAIETAGITLLRSDISLVPQAIQLSRKTLVNIKQNLFWAFSYNVFLIPVAMGILYPTFGIQINPIMASAAMAFSSVSVVLNALRLKRATI